MAEGNEAMSKKEKKPQRYKGNGKHEWEDVCDFGCTQRLRVPGGWIYRDDMTGMAFVPTPSVTGYCI
jgi:hypothetical protein